MLAPQFSYSSPAFAHSSALSPCVLIFSLLRLPARDRHRQVFDPRPLRRTMGEGVFQKVLVVTFGKVGASVRAARLLTVERGVGDGLGHIEHEVELQGSNQLGVKYVALVFDRYVREPLAQLSQSVAGLFHLFLFAIDPCSLLHRLLHLLTNRGDALFAICLLEKLAVETLLFVLGQRG